MDIKKFSNGEAGDVFFFLRITIFYQCNKTYISSFIFVCVIYFTHSLLALLCFNMFFPSPEKLHF